MKNKIKLVIAVSLFSLTLVGYIFYKPVLKNADQPFIELSGAVGDAIGNATDAYREANPIATPAPSSQPQAGGQPRPEKPDSENTSVEVVVDDETISFAGYRNINLTVFKTAFENGVLAGKKIVLVDDYAESKTFHRLIRLFRDTNTDYEIEKRIYDDQ